MDEVLINQVGVLQGAEGLLEVVLGGHIHARQLVFVRQRAHAVLPVVHLLRAHHVPLSVLHVLVRIVVAHGCF